MKQKRGLERRDRGGWEAEKMCVWRSGNETAASIPGQARAKSDFLAAQGVVAPVRIGALCTYREMNQVSGSKPGRCLLLTRRGARSDDTGRPPLLCPLPPSKTAPFSRIVPSSFPSIYPCRGNLPRPPASLRNSSLYRSRLGYTASETDYENAPFAYTQFHRLSPTRE